MTTKMTNAARNYWRQYAIMEKALEDDLRAQGLSQQEIDKKLDAVHKKAYDKFPDFIVTPDAAANDFLK